MSLLCCDERRVSNRDERTLMIARASDVISRDPASATDSESVEVLDSVFEGLVRWNRQGTEVEPALALRWSVDEAGTTWRFALRPNVKFHDGASLDAQSVVLSIDRQRLSTHPMYRNEFVFGKSQFSEISSVIAVAPLEVEIKLRRSYAPFLANLATVAGSIVSPQSLTKGEPAGTGPFAFASWQPGQRLVLTRFASYWGPAPYLQKLVFAVIPDARQRIMALESDVVDLVSGMLPSERSFVQLHPNFQLIEQPGNNVSYLAMNTSKALFNDVRVRQAIAAAINVTPIVKLALQGLAEPAFSPLSPIQWSHWQRANVSQRFAPERAVALLAQAELDGHFDRSRTITLYTSSTPRSYLVDPERVARVIASALAEIGLTVDVVALPYQELRAALQRGDHDMCLFGWVSDNGDPDNTLQIMFSSQTANSVMPQNFAFLRDTEIDRMLLAAQQTMVRSERNVLYEQIQQRLDIVVPWVPIAHATVSLAAHAWLRNVFIGLQGHVKYPLITRTPR
jgi:peptide/nickel transport system substrate-binding protein